MGIVQSDLLIRVAVLKTLEEVKKNPWLLDDIMSDLVDDPLLNEVYGQKEINNAKEWLANNNIEVYLKYRLDSMTYPCVGISLGNSDEDNNESTLADLSTEIEDLSPDKIEKPIPYVVKPFTPISYVDGYILPPDSVQSILVSNGMLLLDPDTGNAYEIDRVDPKGIHIKDAPAISLTRCGVIPQHRIWRARRERAGFRENYIISLHNHGDPAPLIWLYSIVMYGLLRYRESLFEKRGLQISSLKATDVVARGSEFQQGADNIYSRYITLSGLVQNSWLKSPTRIIEKVIVAEKDDEGFYGSGVKFISNEDTTQEVIESDNPNWTTAKDGKPKNTKKVIFRP